MAIEVTKIYKEQFPALRFIGIRYTNEDRDAVTGGFEQWNEWHADDRFTKLKASVSSVPFDESPIGLMTMCGDMTGFTYWIGLFFPASTDVPEGFSFLDLPESVIGVGWVCGKQENGEIFGDAHGVVCNKLTENCIGQFRNDITAENTYCFFERYNCPRFTEKDADGNVTLDYGNYINIPDEPKKTEIDMSPIIETRNLAIRRFVAEDAEAIVELSLDRSKSSMKNFDHRWPTDLESCKGIATYFASDDNAFAVCLKPSMKLIGYIFCNSMGDDGVLDLGHIWHSAYQDNEHDTEALSLMVRHAFEKLGVDGVVAQNPVECEEQIAPLKSIGMETVETQPGVSFVKDKNGSPIEFTACKMLITKEQWEARQPKKS